MKYGASMGNLGRMDRITVTFDPGFTEQATSIPIKGRTTHQMLADWFPVARQSSSLAVY